jgi:hypothetical protein
VFGAILPTGPLHLNAVHSLGFPDLFDTVVAAGLFMSIPVEYFVRVSGKVDIQGELLSQIPFPRADDLRHPIALRALLLNCLTADYNELWRVLHQERWERDRAVGLGQWPGDVSRPTWHGVLPLRRDADRWYAEVELDALAALAFGLTAEDLCAMYLAQFPLLRRNESQMVFDSDGRSICRSGFAAHEHQLALQERAKTGDLPRSWTNLWSLFDEYEKDPDFVDWLGYYTPPFYRPDREAEMTRAYSEFQRRLDAGEYES